MGKFVRIMLWGLGDYDDSLFSVGKVFVVQLAKAIPVGIVAFCISLIFCSLSLSAVIGFVITLALGMGGLIVLD